MTNDRDAKPAAETPAPFAGARYGVLMVKYVPDPGDFLRRRRVPRVRVFCVSCLSVRLVTRAQLVKGACTHRNPHKGLA